MRISLYEKLKQKQLSFIDEVEKIDNIGNNSNTSLYVQLSRAFKKSSYITFFETYEKAVRSILRSDSLYFNTNDNTRQLIQFIKRSEMNISLDCFLDILEFYKTIISQIESSTNADLNQIRSIIEHDCNKLGYKFIEDKETKTYRVMLKNPTAEATAISVKKEIRDKIYDYLLIRKNNIQTKRNCLKSLIDDVEVALKRTDISEYKKIRQFSQCVRHTKNDPMKEFPFFYANEEEWLDKTFEMVIGVLAFENAKKITKEIKELENTN